jgi:hypothetical protein
MVLHFASKKGYNAWNGYRFANGLNKGGRQKVFIRGHLHHVIH